MATINPNWGSWTTTSINASSMSHGDTATTSAISNDNISETEISVTIAYGGTAESGVKVYILRDVDGTNYEAVIDGAFGLMMNYTASQTRRKTITVPGDRISSFKAHLVNESNGTVTATVRYRQATTDVV